MTEVTTPAARATMTWPESWAARASMPVPTMGDSGSQQRHGLALHVRAHQRAVGVVVLQERDERGGHGHDLLGAHVHVVDLAGPGLGELVEVAGRHLLVDEVAVLVELARWPARRSALPRRRRRDTRSRAVTRGLIAKALRFWVLSSSTAACVMGSPLLEHDLARRRHDVLAGDLARGGPCPCSRRLRLTLR